MALGLGRIIARSIGCIMLGAATTVAVAWGLALQGVDYKLVYPQQREWKAIVQPGSPDAVIFEQPVVGCGWSTMILSRKPVLAINDGMVDLQPTGLSLRNSVAYEQAGRLPGPWHSPVGQANHRTEFHFGFPRRAFWATDDTYSEGCEVMDLGPTETLFVKRPKTPSFGGPFIRMATAPGMTSSLAVPTGVLTAGFAIDTAAYAGMWSGVWYLGIVAIRGIRRRRGKCICCTYDRRGLAVDVVCPECGRA